MSELPWPLNLFVPLFEELASKVQEAPFQATEELWSKIRPRLDEAVKASFEAAGDVKKSVDEHSQRLIEKFEKLDERFPVLLDERTQRLLEKFTMLDEKFDKQFEHAEKSFVDALTSAATDLAFNVKSEGEGTRQHVTDTANWMSGTLKGYFDGAVQSVVAALGDVLVGIPGTFTNALIDFTFQLALKSAELAPKSASSFTPGSLGDTMGSISGLMEWLRRTFTGKTLPLVNFIIESRDVKAENVTDWIREFFLKLESTIIDVESLTVVPELFIPLKRLGIGGDFGMTLLIIALSSLAGAAVGSMIGGGLFEGLRAAIASWLQNRTPDVDDLIQCYVEGIIPIDVYLEHMKKHGFNEVWSGKLALARMRYPDPSIVREAYWRGIIDDERFELWHRLQGYHEETLKAFKGLIWKIPSISDLITFVVREVITPEEFYMWARKQGLEEAWARRYWEAHWRLPAFGQLREAYWRGIITPEEFRKFIVWHDYKPEPRPGISKSDLDIMFELQYELPGRIDARWMYEQGVINDEELRKLYKWTGLHPQWLDKTVEATANQVLRAEKESVLREAMYDYRDGWLTEDEFKTVMEQLGIQPRLREFWLARAKMLAAREAREEEKKILIESFRLDYISEGELREHLKALGMRDDAVERIIVIEKLRKLGKAKKR